MVTQSQKKPDKPRNLKLEKLSLKIDCVDKTSPLHSNLLFQEVKKSLLWAKTNVVCLTERKSVGYQTLIES